MPRTMTTAMANALQAPVLYPHLFCSLEFGNSNVYLWDGVGPMSFNSNVYTGVGTLGSIGTISEDSTVEAKGVQVSLSGIPSDVVADVLNETRVLGTCQIWLTLSEPNGAIISDPILSYQGMMDKPQMTDDGQTCSISINLENILVDLNRPCYRRYTNDDQQVDLQDTLTRLSLPSDTVDTAFQFVPGVQERVTFWGTVPSSQNNV